MKLVALCLLVFHVRVGSAQLIANDVVNDYGQVKELLTEFYKRHARKVGNDYDPAVVRNEANRRVFYDGTEASINRNIWSEVFENDIVLTLPQAENLLKEASTRNRRQAQPDPSSFWPSLTISYEFAYNDANFQNLIRSALRHIEQNTCMRFRENGNDRDGLRYFRGSGCWSNVGRTGGRQLVSIGFGCDSLGIIAHETLHALGLWHEQSRDDRDQHIRIQTSRIIRGTEGNFAKRSAASSDNMGQPYDLGSVMHYGPKAFTSDWSFNTIETRDKRYQNTIGQREGISFKDAKMINLRYCSEVCRVKLPCVNDGYTDPNNCRRCKCPRGYGGIYCADLEKSISSCGRELQANLQRQTLDSGPIYANSYCVWRIKAAAGQKVEININSINFPCLDSCTSYVEVKTTTSKTETGARLCCGANYGFVSEGEEITLLLVGDSNLQNGYQGFSASYRAYGEAVTTQEPSSQPTAPVTTTAVQTTTNYGASWGIWGEWSSCSASCGGCGRRKRVRGCYGGNRRCSGSGEEVEACNTFPCTTTKNVQTCKGRILLPCYLVQQMVFGEQPKKWSGDSPTAARRHFLQFICRGGLIPPSTRRLMRKKQMSAVLVTITAMVFVTDISLLYC
ncbi:hypothetical protein Q1695_001659 [Nippostrongylus brasiliensis]|nr:hypothetical protein Q1695_001659 [Nippostrongylus brasiliensis]